REPTVVIAGFGKYPAPVALAAVEGFAGFPLRRERIEFLLEPFLGGFPGVDREARPLGVGPRICSLPLLGRWGRDLAGAGGGRLGPVRARSGGWRTGASATRRRAALTRPCR